MRKEDFYVINSDIIHNEDFYVIDDDEETFDDMFIILIGFILALVFVGPINLLASMIPETEDNAGD
jgi:hypothetical protein